MRNDHRKNRRHFVVNGARISVDRNAEPESCKVIDVSTTGARLKVLKADTVPDNFVLLLSYDGRLQRHCAVVWRTETEIGVEFLPDQPD